MLLRIHGRNRLQNMHLAFVFRAEKAMEEDELLTSSLALNKRHPVLEPEPHREVVSSSCQLESSTPLSDEQQPATSAISRRWWCSFLPVVCRQKETEKDPASSRETSQTSLAQLESCRQILCCLLDAHWKNLHL